VELNNNINEKHQVGELQASSVGYVLEYYQRPFILLHEEDARRRSDAFLPHHIRQRFWQLIPPGESTSQQARDFLRSYLTTVESNLAKLLGELSIAYCLHLYRRLFPGPVGRDKKPYTIGVTRAILESAIQKYARQELCDKIGESAKVPIDTVLGGLLMSPEFENEKNAVLQNNQLVLTNFTSSDLANFYNIEKLAYEIWKTSAVLRAVGKGAPLVVESDFSGNRGEYFADGRSDELDSLLVNYDDRLGRTGRSTTSTGVVYVDWTEDPTGCVLLPHYNVDEITINEFKDFFSKVYRINFVQDFKPNFLWFPFNLRQYRMAHLPFAGSFYKLHNVTLDSVLALIAALFLKVEHLRQQNVIASFATCYQRAYGLSKQSLLRQDLLYLLPYACQILGLAKSAVSRNDFLASINFWTLNSSNRSNINLASSGPHYIFLPIQKGEVIVDYGWIYRNLYNLFRYVHLPNQSFKGDALERIVKTEKSLLPTKPCKSFEGDKRQIDYATSYGSNLIIAECKAVNMSTAFDRGDPQAIAFRTNTVVERALTEIDDKANWLAAHPKGSNYDVSNYKHIVPLAISPFVEFMPSKRTRYWLTNNIPRVLTPDEFKHFLIDFPKITEILNIVPLST